MMKLNLEDLKPAEAAFILSEKPGKTYLLRKFSLAERIWCKRRFGDKIGEVFETQNIGEMAEIAHHLLKDKSEFPTFLAFAECVVTVQDQIALTKALLLTIGIDDAIIKQLVAKPEAESPNAESPNQASIGAPSTTTSQASTATA
jgi:hypothetical protein